MTAGSPRLSHPTGDEVERILGSPIAEELQFLLTRARARSHFYAEEALKELDMNTRLHTILSYLSSGATPSQHNLARLLNIDPSQIVALVDALENNGYVARRVDPNDRRTNAVVITDAGQEFYKKCANQIASAEEEVTSTLSAREKKHLKELLVKISV